MSRTLEQAVQLHRAGDLAGCRRLAAEHPGDGALQHFLGMAEFGAGNLGEARAALERSVALPGSGELAAVSLARCLARLGDWPALAALPARAPAGPPGDEYLHLRARAWVTLGDMEKKAATLGQLADRRPEDRDLQLAAANALVEAGDFAAAERLYRRLLAARPADADALLRLFGLLESLSRTASMLALFEAAEKSGADSRLAALGRALSAREAGEHALALLELERSEGLLPLAAYQHLRGNLADRADRPEIAVEAFTAMNRADAAATPEWREGVRRFRQSIEAEGMSIDRQPPAMEPAPLSPVFLVGFPRSGTTLLDTMLMAHPALFVHEERPFLSAAVAAGDEGASVEAQRSLYLERLRGETPPEAQDRCPVDKNPLGSARAPRIHALFPEAPFLFALRHPCDVVLSCFMTRFQQNWAVASFLDMEETARTYDLVMQVWAEARARLPLRVQEVRYEQLVTKPEATLRCVADFLDIDPEPLLGDHRPTARARGYVPSPSHAQVVQPLYRRAAGRWTRYEGLLAPVMPILEPWIAAHGYQA